VDEVRKIMTNRRVAYYAPTGDRSRHEKLTKQMETIEEKHDIECEEIPTAQFGGINQDWYSKEAETTADEIGREDLSNNQEEQIQGKQWKLPD
jgi:hypothetical protein